MKDQRPLSLSPDQDVFSGVKRDRNVIIPTSPFPSDCNDVRSSTVVTKPLLPVIKCEPDETIRSPAPKIIKREDFTNLPKISIIQFKVEDSNSESESESDSPHHSPSSSGSSENLRANNFRIKDTPKIPPSNANKQPRLFTLSTNDPPKPRYFNPGTGNTKNLNFFNNSNNRNTPSTFAVNNMRTTPNTFAVNTVRNPAMRPFCYKCKRFGHQKHHCYGNWYHWWPSEYLQRYPWLKKKVRDARQLLQRGMMDRYRRAVTLIEDDVEEADWKMKNNNFRQATGINNAYGNNTHNYRGGFTSQGRADGQRILQAMRRVSPSSPPRCCPSSQHQFSFDCQKLIEDLQRQVNNLRVTLTNFKSLSPPAASKGAKFKF